MSQYDDIYVLQNEVLYNQQCKIKDTSVCIAGLGGVGSILCEILSHFGVREFTIIDHDIIELTNITRLVGSNVCDIKKKKTEVARQNIQKICNNQATIKTFDHKICEDTYEEIFGNLNVDFMFGSVDNLLARQYLNKFAIKNKVPYIDVGIGMQLSENKITMLRGQCIFIKPGEPCLMCRGGVDDKLNYGKHSVPIIQINSMLASIASMEFCKYITNISSNHTHIEYDALKQEMQPRYYCKLFKRCDICKQNH